MDPMTDDMTGGAAAAPPAGTMTIDVISDVVCPWCYIGKRRLEGALAQWAAAHPGAPAPRVQWRPFQLNPTLPQTGMSRREYVKRKFGDQGGATYERVAAVGREVGIPFAFDAIERQPNTLATHALIGASGELGIQDAMVETLFRAYFLDGRDMTDRATLPPPACRARRQKPFSTRPRHAKAPRWKTSAPASSACRACRSSSSTADSPSPARIRRRRSCRR